MNNGPNTLPKARKENLIIKELEDETLVYDLEQDKAHCLNHTAGLVWKHCDGKTGVSEIAKFLGYGQSPEADESLVWIALDQLEEFQLLNEPISKPVHLSGVSRRQLMRTLAVGAVFAVPLITSILVPTPAQAASCTAVNNRDIDCPCTASAQCTSGCCRDVGGGVFLCKSGAGGCV